MRMKLTEAQQMVAIENVTPIWLLVFLRLVRGEADGSFARAFAMLPSALPTLAPCPTKVEAAVVLAYHRLGNFR